MNQETIKEKKPSVFLPWVVTLAVLVTASLLLYDYYGGFTNPFETQLNKINLISAMRIHLLEATEAEKNAVLATTDDESKTFAAQAHQAANGVENSRQQLESLFRLEKHPREIETINKFSACWSEYKKLDETILDLAVQNTNLKAEKLSSNQCAQEMERLEESLDRLIHRNMDDDRYNKAIVLSYEALTASLKIFALHKPHIEEAEDKTMDQIEQRIKSYDESARKALEALQAIAGRNDEDLQAAETAYRRFMDLTREVLRLSRMNTNIKSAALSIGIKRLVAAQCQDILASLQKTVQTQQSLPTR
ncbi:MAG: MCP four helix bundle domain-containing protein [Methylomicrobium sp.]